MRKGISIVDLLELSVPERLQLVEDLWDSIAAVPDALALSEGQKAELDRRLAAHRKNPRDSSPWATVKARIRSRA